MPGCTPIITKSFNSRMHACTDCIPFHPILVPLAAKNCKMQSKAYPIFLILFDLKKRRIMRG